MAAMLAFWTGRHSALPADPMSGCEMAARRAPRKVVWMAALRGAHWAAGKDIPTVEATELATEKKTARIRGGRAVCTMALWSAGDWEGSQGR